MVRPLLCVQSSGTKCPVPQRYVPGGIPHNFRVISEKWTGPQLVQKFPALYATRLFITAFRSTHHLPLSWARSIHSMPPHPTSWRSILILSSHLAYVFQVVSFPYVSPAKPCIHLSSPPTYYMPRPSHFSWFYHPCIIWWGVQIIKLLVM